MQSNGSCGNLHGDLMTLGFWYRLFHLEYVFFLKPSIWNVKFLNNQKFYTCEKNFLSVPAMKGTQVTYSYICSSQERTLEVRVEIHHLSLYNPGGRHNENPGACLSTCICMTIHLLRECCCRLSLSQLSSSVFLYILFSISFFFFLRK